MTDEQELFKNASPEVREVVKRVVEVEKEKLYQDKPRINDDIIKIIQEVVNETNIDSII